MRIDRVEWWEVNQFVHQEMVNSPEYARTHERWDLVTKFLVRLHTDDGHYGVGETPRGAPRQGVEDAARALLGADPRALCLRHLPLGSVDGEIYFGQHERVSFLWMYFPAVPKRPAAAGQAG